MLEKIGKVLVLWQYRAPAVAVLWQYSSSCPSVPKEGGSTQLLEKSASKQSSAGGSRPKVSARVYALDHQQIPDSTEVVEGTIPIFHRLAKILIDPGATHSFVNPKFMSGVDVKPIKLPYDLEVRTPMGIKA